MKWKGKLFWTEWNQLYPELNLLFTTSWRHKGNYDLPLSFLLYFAPSLHITGNKKRVGGYTAEINWKADQIGRVFISASAHFYS
jgi:hypothetical protein